MHRAVPLSQFMPYGAPDLIAAGPAHLSRAVVASSALAVAAFLFLVLVVPVVSKHRVVVEAPPKSIVIQDFMLPEPIVQRSEPAAAVIDGEPDIGSIQPVADRAEFVEPAGPPGPKGEVPESRAGEAWSSLAPAQPHVVEPLPDRGTWVYSDELPMAVIDPRPEYPSIAREAGVEGVVLVHVLVGKDGRVMRAEIDEKRSIPLLDGAALEAVRRWVFKPALANNRPVVVWMALPFRFRLNH